MQRRLRVSEVRMMMKQRKATGVQNLMIGLMLIVWGSLFMWVVPEVRGIFNPADEDTYSEWVWDLPLWAVLTIAGLHLIAGVLFVWSAGHFIEGYMGRR